MESSGDHIEELRQKLAIEAFTEPQRLALDEFHLRPFSAMTRLLCAKLGLTMFTGTPREEIEPAEQEEQFYAFLYIQSQPEEVVLANTADPEVFRNKVLPKFLFGVDIGMLPALGELLGLILSRVGANLVAVQPKPGGNAGPEPPGNS
jgi:hypothetical protein